MWLLRSCPCGENARTLSQVDDDFWEACDPGRFVSHYDNDDHDFDDFFDDNDDYELMQL